MSVATRMYIVTNKTNGEKTLVEETHPLKAVRSVTSEDYEVESASTIDIVDLLQKGARVIRPTQAAEAEISAA